MADPTEPSTHEPALAAPAIAKPRWRRERSFLWMAVEVALISARVFLGLAGQQWLENRQRRDEARASLQRFRAELEVNRKEVATKLEYHRSLAAQLRPYVRTDPAKRGPANIAFDGLQPPLFETTAWDVAIGTQSLADIGQDLAFTISRIYRYQRLVDEQTKAMTQAMFLRPPWENGPAFLLIVEPYYSDLIGIEPEMLKMYESVLREIDAALAD
jgi:hypothetical protein